MAEKEKKPQIEKKAPTEKKVPYKEEEREYFIRIYGYDIPGNKNIFVGLTKIKGISWSISNFICKKLELDRTVKVADLGKDVIARIEKSLESLEIPSYMKNRRADYNTGEDKHLLANNLDMQKEFDIKRMKKIKSYKGMRHAYGQPVRGQRTRSHFRKKGKAVGGKKNAKKA